jgi:hypothetical protein
MKFAKTIPDQEGFYWCKPVFSNITLTGSIGEPFLKPSIAQIVTMERTAMGSNLFVKFVGHKYPYSINSPVIQHTLWGGKVIMGKEEC